MGCSDKILQRTKICIEGTNLGVHELSKRLRSAPSIKTKYPYNCFISVPIREALILLGMIDPMDAITDRITYNAFLNRDIKKLKQRFSETRKEIGSFINNYMYLGDLHVNREEVLAALGHELGHVVYLHNQSNEIKLPFSYKKSFKKAISKITSVLRNTPILTVGSACGFYAMSFTPMQIVVNTVSISIMSKVVDKFCSWLKPASIEASYHEKFADKFVCKNHALRKFLNDIFTRRERFIQSANLLSCELKQSKIGKTLHQIKSYVSLKMLEIRDCHRSNLNRARI